MKDTIVERIVHNVCGDIKKHWKVSPALVGVIDDQPLSVDEYEYPPNPLRAGWGESGLPFAFVYELEEVPNLGGTVAWNNTLNGQVQVFFRYSINEPDKRLAPLGRSYRGEIKRALMLDHTRGGVAFRTVFGRNFVDTTPIDGIGAAVVDFEVQYFHNLKDPASRDTAH